MYLKVGSLVDCFVSYVLTVVVQIEGISLKETGNVLITITN